MAGPDDAKLRELCEKASKEYDHDKLVDLVRQISELLDKRRKSKGEDRERKALPAGRLVLGSRLPQADARGSFDELLPHRRIMRAADLIFAADGHGGSCAALNLPWITIPSISPPDIAARKKQWSAGFCTANSAPVAGSKEKRSE